MDPRMLEYYNQELLHIREGAAEFAREFPKIAARLGLEPNPKECPDPYVERLLEGFAYLAGRIQLKIESEYPTFTQNLLEMVYPEFQAPTPSMAIMEFALDAADPGLTKGFTLPRQTVLRSRLTPGESTVCEYRTAHAITFWPLRMAEARYHAYVPDIPTGGAMLPDGVRGALRLTLQTTGGLNFRQLEMDRLTVHLSGDPATAHKLHENICANTVGVIVRPGDREAQWSVRLDGTVIEPLGFDDDESLLPPSPHGFGGYRLLKEYSALPARFLFFDLVGLRSAVGRCEGNSLEVLVLLGKVDATLEKLADSSNFVLHAAPAINLFPKRADRIHLDDGTSEFHVVPERTRPMDFEVYRISDVTGYGAEVDALQKFEPFYAVHDLAAHAGAYYGLRRLPRLPSAGQQLKGTRTGYLGTEVFVSLVDSANAPYASEVKQLSVNTLCSNRDLPLLLTLGGEHDFSLEVSAPVTGIRCISGPSRPLPPVLAGETPWRLISHLSLNYLSIMDSDARQGAAALRELLSLYGSDPQSPMSKEIEGIQSVAAQPVVRRMPSPGPIAFGRGVEIRLTLDERAFEGSGIFVLGAVLERFFARHASLNSFTQTVLQSATRGEIKRWPARLGQRQTI